MKNSEDKEFGKGVYEKVSERIVQLKNQEIQNRITHRFNQSPQLPVQPPQSTQLPDQFQQFQQLSQFPANNQPIRFGMFNIFFRSTLISS